METPECDKLLEAQEKSLLLSEFVDWLKENGYAICERASNEPDAVMDSLKGEDPRESYAWWRLPRIPTEAIFAKFFGIDLAKVEEERRAILEDLKNAGRDN
jgi:hypothetical protein